MKKINGKESNTAEGVNIATDLNEFKNVLLVKKIIRHKMRRLQSKKYKVGTYEIDKISLSCLYDKRCVLDDEIHTLAYFHKDSVTGCKEIQKACEKKEEIKKDCDNTIFLFFSSNVNEVIRLILNLFFISYGKISHTPKAYKA